MTQRKKPLPPVQRKTGVKKRSTKTIRKKVRNAARKTSAPSKKPHQSNLTQAEQLLASPETIREMGSAPPIDPAAQPFKSSEELGIDESITLTQFQKLVKDRLLAVEEMEVILKDIESILFSSSFIATLTPKELMEAYRVAHTRQSAHQNFVLRAVQMASKAQIEQAWLLQAEKKPVVVAVDSEKNKTISRMIIAEMRKRVQES